MKKYKCPSCGATITNGVVCSYCGEELEFDKSGEPIVPTYKLSDDEIDIVMHKLNGSLVAVIPILAFMVLWCGTCFGMGIFALIEAGLMGLMPIGMGMFGLVFMTFAIKATVGTRLTKLIRLWNDKKYDEALALCESKKHNNLYALLYSVIQFNHYNNTTGLRNILLTIPNSTLNGYYNRATLIKDMLEYYNVSMYTTYSTSSSNVNPD